MDLNVFRVGADLMLRGSFFHRSGPITAKARSPLVTRFDHGTFRDILSLDLSLDLGLELMGWSRRSLIYAGERPLRAL